MVAAIGDSSHGEAIDDEVVSHVENGLWTSVFGP